MMIVTCPNCLRIMMDGSSLNTATQQEKDAVALHMTCRCKEVLRVQITVLHQGDPVSQTDCPHLNVSIYDADHQQCIDCGTKVRWVGPLSRPSLLTKPRIAQPMAPSDASASAPATSIKQCTCGALGALSHQIGCPRYVKPEMPDLPGQTTAV